MESKKRDILEKIKEIKDENNLYDIFIFLSEKKKLDISFKNNKTYINISGLNTDILDDIDNYISKYVVNVDDDNLFGEEVEEEVEEVEEEVDEVEEEVEEVEEEEIDDEESEYSFEDYC